MTWPKISTRKIVVNGETYLWQRDRYFMWKYRHWTAIQKSGCNGQFLFLNEMHHDLPLGPGAIRLAIDFALSKGWNPDVKGAPMKLRYNGDNFWGDAFTILPIHATIDDLG